MYMNTIRANIIFPKELLLEVDRFVGKGKRSAFLAESAREYLARLKFAKVAEESKGILKSKDYPQFATTKKVTAYIRDLRRKNDTRFKK